MNPSISNLAAPVSASTELAQITVTSRIPDFWTEMPRLWFAQFEAIITPQKQSDEVKYNVVISKLSRDALQQISDILLSPPDSNKYQIVKERLLQVFEESAERQFQKLVGEMDLGSQKPSQLLRKMRDLGRNTQVSEQTLRSLWTSRMPPAVRAVIAVSSDQELDIIARIADKVMESVSYGNIAEVNSCSGNPSTSSSGATVPFGELLHMMQNLKVEVAALRAQVNRSGYHRSRSNSRGRARPRSKSRDVNHPNWLCKYHYRYRGKATRCEKPCAWDPNRAAAGRQGN